MKKILILIFLIFSVFFRLQQTSQGEQGGALDIDELNVNGKINAMSYYQNGLPFGNGSWGISGTNIYNLNSGNVGIGTTTPSALFHVAGAAVTIPATAGNITFVQTDGSGGYEAWGGEHKLRIYAYKTVNSVKVYSPVYQTASQYSSYTEAPAYFTWGWTAVSGAEGYRVFVYSDGVDLLSFNYDYYKDVTTNSFTDNGSGYTAGTETYNTVPATLYSGEIIPNGYIQNLYGVNPTNFYGNLRIYGNLDVRDQYKISGSQFAYGDGAGNTSAGLSANASLTTGTGNTSVGRNAGTLITSGISNTNVGDGAGNNITTSSLNNLFGLNSGSTLTTGGSNNIFGSSAAITTGSNNNLFGNYITNIGSGSNNIGIGNGIMFVSGYSDNLMIGASGVGPSSDSNAIIGSQLQRFNEFYFGAGYRANPGGATINSVIHEVTLNATNWGGMAGQGVNSKGADLGLSGGRGFISGADSAPGGVVKFYFSHNETPQMPYYLTPRWEKMRVVSDGLMIGDAYSVGTEKITNGTFTGNANNWTLNTGWAYSSNTVVKNANGTGTLEQTAANMVTAPVAGEWYVLDFTITNWTVSGLVDVVAGGTRITTFNAADRHIFLFQATNTTGLYFYPSNTSRFTIDNVSLKPLIGGNLSIYGGLKVREQTNGTMGTATLVAGTVTVNTTKVTANSRVFLTTQSAGGTVGYPYISARTAGTSFTITSSSAADTSTVAWLILEPI